ncbi:hypothetical protein F5X68DRAFT_43395 [Plectosphaerella plurivora]|uniref:Secreted protein n=1 Tax=Plectosphaerella plurivora TaxID=936078 RepID=A0A9P8V3I3_9PEZI|nr:hypothetical protein F5X68DRAFT_43395 [Plectosphaerella plurivora]
MPSAHVTSLILSILAWSIFSRSSLLAWDLSAVLGCLPNHDREPWQPRSHRPSMVARCLGINPESEAACIKVSRCCLCSLDRRGARLCSAAAPPTLNAPPS